MDFKKIFASLFLSCSLLVGLLSLYRASIKVSGLTVIIDKVVDKKISYFTSFRSGRHYSLIFTLEGQIRKIAINLGTKSEAEKDSTYYLINTFDTYKFYIDPTIPTVDGVSTGIQKIDFDGKEVFRASNKLNLFGGTFISLLSLAGLFLIYKYKKTKNSS